MKYSAKQIVLSAISSYQALISPDHGIFYFFCGRARCRFYPSCSEYAKDAIRQYGLLRGSMFSLARIARCGPWSRGGIDEVRIKNCRDS